MATGVAPAGYILQGRSEKAYTSANDANAKATQRGNANDADRAPDDIGEESRAGGSAARWPAGGREAERPIRRGADLARGDTSSKESKPLGNRGHQHLRGKETTDGDTSELTRAATRAGARPSRVGRYARNLWYQTS